MNPRKKKSKTTIEIPSESTYIRVVSDKILGSLKSYDLDDSDLFDIKLCIEEALRNAMVHGSRFKKELPIKVSYSFEEGLLEIEIEDKGDGFDYNGLPDPTQDENILREGGRGVFLIRNLMDEVNFNEKGNKVTMVKKIKHGGTHADKDRG